MSLVLLARIASTKQNAELVAEEYERCICN
jgi:hypothetical protein